MVGNFGEIERGRKRKRNINGNEANEAKGEKITKKRYNYLYIKYTMFKDTCKSIGL